MVLKLHHKAFFLSSSVSKEYHRTVLMVTHDPRIAAYADRIVFLKDGRMIDDTLLERKNAL
jgi:putative ABC transport system ATP-binding protein